MSDTAPGTVAGTVAEPEPVEPQADAPAEPKAKRTRKPRSTTGGRPSGKDKRREAVADQLTSIGMALNGVGFVAGQPALAADGRAVLDHADNIAGALAELAETNPRVAKFIDGGVSGSAWIGVAIAVGGLARDIAANHLPEPEPELAETVEPGAPSAFGGLADLVGGAR